MLSKVILWLLLSKRVSTLSILKPHFQNRQSRGFCYFSHDFNVWLQVTEAFSCWTRIGSKLLCYVPCRLMRCYGRRTKQRWCRDTSISSSLPLSCSSGWSTAHTWLMTGWRSQTSSNCTVASLGTCCLWVVDMSCSHWRGAYSGPEGRGTLTLSCCSSLSCSLWRPWPERRQWVY